MLPGAFAQSSSNCGNTTPEIIPTPNAIPLCEGIPTEELTISLYSNLPYTEFFIIDVDRMADDGLGSAIMAVTDDDIFVPQDYELTYNQRFALRPFAFDINEFRNLIDVIFTSTFLDADENGEIISFSCCSAAEAIAKEFCENLPDYGIYSSENVNNLNDVWNILKVSAGNAGSSFSVDGFIQQIELLEGLINTLPEGCQNSSEYCYALGANEQLFEILEVPQIVEVMTDTPHEITINSTITDGILQYSIDQDEWQDENIIRDTPSEGTAYVREKFSDCSEAMYFSNPNLNVELKEFKGTDETTTNLLYWVTETEINNAGFGVERSTDGENFKEIAWVDGALNSSARLDYTYRDMSPLTGASYYRLAMEDTGGRVEHSDVEVVKRNDGTGFGIISIGPNPSANLLNVSILNEEELGDVEYMIYDLMGRKVRHGKQQLTLGINNFSVEAAMMGTGMYLFTAAKGDYVVSAYKFVMH